MHWKYDKLACKDKFGTTLMHVVECQCLTFSEHWEYNAYWHTWQQMHSSLSCHLAIYVHSLQQETLCTGQWAYHTIYFEIIKWILIGFSYCSRMWRFYFKPSETTIRVQYKPTCSPVFYVFSCRNKIQFIISSSLCCGQPFVLYWAYLFSATSPPLL